MTSLEVLRCLNAINPPLVTTRDVADLFHITKTSASKYMDALREQNFVEKMRRGKWAIKNSNFDPLQVAEFLVAPNESYISLHTAFFITT